MHHTNTGIFNKKVYIPYMSDTAYALSAAFIRCGIDSSVLDEPNESTLNYGLKFTNGNECMPCFVTTGDIIKVLEKPGFDAKKSAFFMPTFNLYQMQNTIWTRLCPGFCAKMKIFV